MSVTDEALTYLIYSLYCPHFSDKETEVRLAPKFFLDPEKFAVIVRLFRTDLIWDSPGSCPMVSPQSS
jgi:hypothetical protein